MAEQDKGMFGFDKNPSNILPKKYTLNSKIKFKCHPGVSCFTACCGNINIILTPFDILRLRKYLNLPAAEFLLRFTTPMFIEKTDMPGVKIHLDENGRCPFVTEAGCTIYPERPSACRYYPVGMANFHEGGEEGIDSERFFFLVKESHCKGHEEDKEWTIREWREDQGVDLCDEMNREWLEIVMRRKSFGFQASLSEQAKKMFFMVSTDLDKFREFIFTSSFLDIYEIGQETLDKIKEDDIALLRFSYKYLASSLFGTKDLKIRDEKIKAKAAELNEKRSHKESEAVEIYEELKAERDRMAAELKEKNK
ncbi:MAG: YkgJ family cysteine cluster protein [Deltaproteobacteria bacterium]|nr:YkgJ family cysteine cluster protein [Deltaproteobacteria bacterium]